MEYGVCATMANVIGKRSKRLSVVRKLPPSFHKLPGEAYDVSKSQVIQWLIKQPEIQEFVWDQFKTSKDVFYDRETGKWQGIDYEKFCSHGGEWDDCPVCRH